MSLETNLLCLGNRTPTQIIENIIVEISSSWVLQIKSVDNFSSRYSQLENLPWLNPGSTRLTLGHPGVIFGLPGVTHRSPWATKGSHKGHPGSPMGHPVVSLGHLGSPSGQPGSPEVPHWSAWVTQGSSWVTQGSSWVRASSTLFGQGPLIHWEVYIFVFIEKSKRLNSLECVL